MAVNIPVRGDTPSFDVDNVSLAGRRYNFLFRWNWRSNDWRMTVVDVATEKAVATSRRLSPGYRAAILDEGEIHVRGPDPYKLTDLGRKIVVRFFTNAEMAEFANIGTFGEDPPFALV